MGVGFYLIWVTEVLWEFLPVGTIRFYDKILE